MWIYKGKDVTSVEKFPGEPIGFIYKIINETNGMFYIGKKNFFHVTNPEISKAQYDRLKAKGVPVTKTKNKTKSKKGSIVWRYKQKDKTTETNWKDYYGSNKQLIEDLKSGHKMKREIVKLCYTKTDLTLREVEAQFQAEVLDRCDSYNGNILAKFFKQVQC